MNDFYSRYTEMYKQGSPEARARAKAHWIANHKENVKHSREDLIIFSAQMLAAIAMAEAELAETGE